MAHPSPCPSKRDVATEGLNTCRRFDCLRAESNCHVDGHGHDLRVRGQGIVFFSRPTTNKMVDRLVTINVLPDDALLLIFFFHRRLTIPNFPPLWVYWEWHELAHVCRRWRRVIFASPRHLKLRLLITGKGRRTTFECWPPCPISIWPNTEKEMSLVDDNEVAAALKHSNRIHEIKLEFSTSMLAKSTAWFENSFPALEFLNLRSFSHEPTVIPNAFLMGGSDGPPRRLRKIALSNVSLPHGLLRANRDLVTLFLNINHVGGAGSLSAEALALALAETHLLETLSVYPHTIVASYPDQRSAQRSSLTNTRVNLCALATLEFMGPCEYLEDLVSRIDTPILKHLVASFPQSIFDVPQLSQFISRTNHLTSLPHRTTIGFSSSSHKGLFIRHHFMTLESQPPREAFSLTLSISKRWVVSNWIASQVLHICEQLSPFTSSVDRLWISIGMVLDPDTDTERWLELLGAFRSVQDLHLWCSWWDRAPAVDMERALEESTKREMTQEVLPVLRILRMNETRVHECDTHGISAFVDARRRTGRPLVVHEGPSSCQVEEE